MESKITEILLLIEKHVGRVKKPINSRTTLDKDLCIVGLDAYDIIVDFGKTFNVDVSEFDIWKYFTCEGLNLLGFLWGEKEQKQKELCIGDLIRAIEAGKLNDEVIGGE